MQMELVSSKRGQKGLIHKEHEKGSKKRVWEGTTWQKAGQQAVSNNPNARQPEGWLRIRKTQVCSRPHTLLGGLAFTQGDARTSQGCELGGTRSD